MVAHVATTFSTLPRPRWLSARVNAGGSEGVNAMSPCCSTPKLTVTMTASASYGVAEPFTYTMTLLLEEEVSILVTTLLSFSCTASPGSG